MSKVKYIRLILDDELINGVVFLPTCPMLRILLHVFLSHLRRLNYFCIPQLA